MFSGVVQRQGVCPGRPATRPQSQRRIVKFNRRRQIRGHGPRVKSLTSPFLAGDQTGAGLALTELWLKERDVRRLGEMGDLIPDLCARLFFRGPRDTTEKMS